MSRQKVAPDQRATPRAISLFPNQTRFADKRSFDANISFSKYVQHLIEWDRTHNVLPKALVKGIVKTSTITAALVVAVWLATHGHHGHAGLAAGMSVLPCPPCVERAFQFVIRHFNAFAVATAIATVILFVL